MKNPLMVLLLLLSLAAILRKSSGSPSPSHARNKFTPVIVGLTTSLTKSIDRIIEDSIDDSLDEVIRKMKVKVSNIPWDEKDAYQKVMEGLINSQKYVNRTRSALERFAIKLKKRCRSLISIYNHNELTVGIFKYSVKKFKDLSIIVKRHLEKALKQLKETSKELTKTETYLEAFNNSKRVEEHDYIKEQNKDITKYEREKKRAAIGSSVSMGISNVLSVITPLGLVALYGGALGFVAHPVYDKKIANIRRRVKELQNRYKDITSQVSGLINQTEDISSYIEEEINLLDDWTDKLADSLLDHNITQAELEAELEYGGIEEIKKGVTDVMKACENYLEHRFIPDNEIQCIYYEIVEVCINYQDLNSTAVPHFDDLSTLNNKMKENCINHQDPNLPDVTKYQISENHCIQVLTEGNVN